MGIKFVLIALGFLSILGTPFSFVRNVGLSLPFIEGDLVSDQEMQQEPDGIDEGAEEEVVDTKTITSSELEKLISTGALTIDNLNIVGGLTVSGNKIIDSAGKIPAITTNYFSNLDASTLTSIDAAYLSGKDISNLLRSNEVDIAEAKITFAAQPFSTNVADGSLYINPKAASGNQTLFGIAIDDSEIFKIDAEGDLFLQGNLSGSVTATSITSGLVTATGITSSGDIVLDPQGKALYLTSGSGNAPWRVFNSTATSPNTDDQVFLITNNALYTPADGWQARDVDGLGVMRLALESHWSAGGAINPLAEFNLDIAPKGTGNPTFGYRAFHLAYDWVTEAASWQFWTQGTGDYYFRSRQGGATDLGEVRIDSDALTLIVRGRSSQTNNLQEWHNSGGTTLSYVDSNGAFNYESNADVYPIFLNPIYDPTGSEVYQGIRGLIDMNSANSTTAQGFGALFMGRALGSGTYFKVYGAELAGSVGNSASVTNLYGLDAIAATTSTGNVTTAYGVYSRVLQQTGSGGTILTAYGSNSQVIIQSAANGDITNAYGNYIQVDDQSGAGTGDITNAYGLYVADVDTAQTLNYAVYINAGDVIFNAGNDSSTQVGIGDTTPTETLTVYDDFVGYAGSFFNDGNLDTHQGVFIQGCLDTNPTASCNLLEFRSGDATVLGAIEGNAAGGVTNASSGSDYAELFSGDRNMVEAGDIIGLDSEGKAVKATFFATKLIGAYSTTPVTLGNWKDGWENDNALIPVGLLGQLKVKVINDKEVISKSDPIGVSPTHPGVGVKATNSQKILGYALEETQDTGGIQEILIYVSPSWHGTDISELETELSLLKSQQTINEASAKILENGTSLETLLVTGDTILSNTVINGKLDIGTLTFDNRINSIDAIGTLFIQPLALGDIQFLGGIVTINKEGNIVLEVDGDIEVKGGIILNPENKERPECNEETRGTHWFIRSESGKDDTFEGCRRKSDGLYEWMIIY